MCIYSQYARIDFYNVPLRSHHDTLVSKAMNKHRYASLNDRNTISKTNNSVHSSLPKQRGWQLGSAPESLAAAR